MSLSSSIKNSFSLESSTGEFDREAPWVFERDEAFELAREPELVRLPEPFWALEPVEFLEPVRDAEEVLDPVPDADESLEPVEVREAAPERFVAEFVFGIQWSL